MRKTSVTKVGVKALVLLGMVLGLALFAGFKPSGSGVQMSDIVARGFSFLSDDSRACVNCHVMESRYEAWFHSPHREVTTCSGCHLPNGNAATKWLVKAQVGAKDTFKFLTGAYPVNIHIADGSKAVVQANCLRCHGELVREIGKGEGKPCFSCHRNTSHPL
jgi:cytochrome c nitrite reductase small subunit